MTKLSKIQHNTVQVNQIVFLIGMPTAGKSSLCAPLGRRLSLPYHDLDNLIEQEVGCTISTYFSTFGEQSFRDLETQILTKIIEKKQPILLATGGGAPCFAANMDNMLASGIVIFLDPPIQHIIGRLHTGKRRRPLFDGIGSELFAQKVLTLYENRLPFYQRAHIRVRTIRNSSSYIAGLICAYLGAEEVAS